MTKQIPDAWSRSSDALLSDLGVDATAGLNDTEVMKRQRECGLNQLTAAPRRAAISILLYQFRSITVILLLAAGSLAFVFADYAEGTAIFAVIVINAMLGFFTELRAVRSMEALSEFTRTECTVLRSGKAVTVAAEEVVPGDIVMLDAGDLVPADIRLLTVAKLTANESTLTGESLPVHKDLQILPADTSMLERSNMLFKGSSITRGSGTGLVIGTGSDTEFGKIFEQVSEAKPQQTPLEKRLNRLAAHLASIIGVIAVVIAVAGIFAGRELYLAIEVAIALSVAAIPEGLAIVATIALARGMWRLARRNALITRLSAVETLGATSVILTDKTGTLTENCMAVSRVLLPETAVDFNVPGNSSPASPSAARGVVDDAAAKQLDALFRAAVLCSNASLEPPTGTVPNGIGDPTEVALLVAAGDRDIWRAEEAEKMPELREDPFDPDTRRMATLHRAGTEFRVFVKGAPESVIPCCTTVNVADGTCRLDEQQRRSWLQRADELGNDGLRTLAVAQKKVAAGETGLYDELELIGIVGLQDPARTGVRRAIERCHRAGITVVMVTGDHASTARNIGVATGIVSASAGSDQFRSGPDVDVLCDGSHDEALLETRVFSRVTPEQKLRLIHWYQQRGHVVAMTGDGVNDAPALKKADIGVAMGLRGTAVAKEAAAMILQDDEFNTIVTAVAFGRAIFENIRKFVIYLLSCNSSEVMVIGLATIVGGPLPLLPLQILFLNFVTDVFPALALGVGEGSPRLMRQPPRTATERLLMPRHWRRIALHGVVIALVVLAAMAIALYLLEYDYKHSVSVAFLTLALAQMWHVFNMRGERRRPFDNEITRNPWIWVALCICLVCVFAAIYVPFLSNILVLAAPGWRGWAVILLMSLLPLIAAPLIWPLTEGDAAPIALE